MINIKFNYGQPSSGWTREKCQSLHKKQDNVQQLIEELDPLFEILAKVNSNRKLEQSRPLLDQKAISKDIELYEKTWPILKNYCEKHKETLNDDAQYTLNNILAKIFAQLKHFDKACEYDKEAEKFLNQLIINKYQGYDFSILTKKLSRRIVKHELMKNPSLISEKENWTPEEILVFRTYIGQVEQEKKKKFAEILLKEYEKPREARFSRLVLYMSALGAINEATFGIFFSSKLEDVNAKYIKYGSYSFGNKIYINQEIQKISMGCNPQATYEEVMLAFEIKKTLLHEWTHRAMDRLFENTCRPYFKGDNEAKNAYRECMRQVILNIVKNIYPKDILEGMECDDNNYYLEDMECRGNKSYTVEIETDVFLFQLSNIYFPHPWSESLSLEELIENCYGDHGILKQATLKIKKVSDEAFYFLKTFEAIESLASYPRAYYDREFITHMTDLLITYPKYEKSHFYKIFKNYLDHYVIPLMESYVANHPSKSKVVFH